MLTPINCKLDEGSLSSLTGHSDCFSESNQGLSRAMSTRSFTMIISLSHMICNKVSSILFINYFEIIVMYPPDLVFHTRDTFIATC